jgi:hypothetical protein
MRKTLIFYKPEFIVIAKDIRNNYLAHGNTCVDIISEEEEDDIEYARKMNYDEAIFIENEDSVIIHYVSSGFTNRCPVSDVYIKEV